MDNVLQRHGRMNERMWMVMVVVDLIWLPWQTQFLKWIEKSNVSDDLADFFLKGPFTFNRKFVVLQPKYPETQLTTNIQHIQQLLQQQKKITTTKRLGKKRRIIIYYWVFFFLEISTGSSDKDRVSNQVSFMYLFVKH